MILLTEEKLIQQHIGNVASVYAGTPVGFNAGIVRRTTFVVTEGAGGIGTGLLLVNASATPNMASPTPIPFKVRVQASATTSDTYTPAAGYTPVTSAGYTTTAGANKLIFIEVDSRDIPSGNQFIALTPSVATAGACAGSVLAIGHEPMFVGVTPPTTFS